MGPKKELSPDLKKDDVVLAVVVADSFNKKFGPLTSPTVPKCLLPLANRPMLSYTLEFLKNSGVQEVILYCTDFAPEVRNYLSASGDATWATMSITTIGNEGCRSLGDAMRDLDAKGLLRHDFILISSGDTISNVNLLPLLAEHKKNFQTDKNSTMTLIYKKASPGHHCRSLDEEVVVAASKQGRVLHHVRAAGKKLDFPLEIFAENEAVDLRFDLLETGIAICSQAVPPLFSDNFDCQTLDEFIKGTLENDLTDHTIYMSTIEDESYAARIHNILSYMAITRDIVHRWLFPIVPEVGSQDHCYSYLRRNVYKAMNVIIKKQSILDEDLIIGHGSMVGEKSLVSRSTIGRNCKIGDNVILRNCVIHDDVIIEDGCRIDCAVIGSKVQLGKAVVIQEKCLLGSGVQVKPNVTLPIGTRLVSVKESSGFSDDEDEAGVTDEAASSFGPAAFVYDSDEDEADSQASGEGSDIEHDPWGVALQSAGDDSSSEDEDGSDISGMEDIGMPDIMLDEDAKYDVFFGEVLESLQRGAKEGVNADNLSLEVNSSRHAYAVTPTQVIQSVYISILTIAKAQDGSEESSAKLFAASKKSLAQFKQLLMKYVKSQQAQINCLNVIANHAKSNPDYMPIVANIVHFLHDQDILSEEAILSWYPELTGPLAAKLKNFIDWLEQDSEEDSDSDDESD